MRTNFIHRKARDSFTGHPVCQPSQTWEICVCYFLETPPSASVVTYATSPGDHSTVWEENKIPMATKYCFNGPSKETENFNG